MQQQPVSVHMLLHTCSSAQVTHCHTASDSSNGLLLCCLLVLQGPVGRMVGGSPICVQWPLLLALCAAVGWLYMSKLKPLQFSDAALEQHFAMRSQHGRGASRFCRKGVGAS